MKKSVFRIVDFYTTKFRKSNKFDQINLNERICFEKLLSKLTCSLLHWLHTYQIHTSIMIYVNLGDPKIKLSTIKILYQPWDVSFDVSPTSSDAGDTEKGSNFSNPFKFQIEISAQMFPFEK